MNTPEKPQLPGQIDVAFWNVCFDQYHDGKVARQHTRVPDLVKTISSINKTFDLVGLTEVEGENKDNNWHNGEEIARQLGYDPGFWQKHSPENSGGYEVGAFGAAVKDAEFVYLGHGKKAMLTHIGSIPVAVTHLKYQLTGRERTYQLESLMDHMSDSERGIILLDKNSLPTQKPSKVMKRFEYRSVFASSVRKLWTPTVHVVPEYRRNLLLWQRMLVRFGLPIDDIRVKGLHVVDAGVIKGDSDHALVHATLAEDKESYAA